MAQNTPPHSENPLSKTEAVPQDHIHTPSKNKSVSANRVSSSALRPTGMTPTQHAQVRAQGQEKPAIPPWSKSRPVLTSASQPWSHDGPEDGLLVRYIWAPSDSRIHVHETTREAAFRREMLGAIHYRPQNLQT